MRFHTGRFPCLRLSLSGDKAIYLRTPAQEQSCGFTEDPLQMGMTHLLSLVAMELACRFLVPDRDGPTRTN
jgi:hypothetical protein